MSSSYQEVLLFLFLYLYMHKFTSGLSKNHMGIQMERGEGTTLGQCSSEAVFFLGGFPLPCVLLTVPSTSLRVFSLGICVTRACVNREKLDTRLYGGNTFM